MRQAVDNLCIEKEFTISNGQTQVGVAAGIDTAEYTVVGVRCPASIGSAVSMTFDGSSGDITNDTHLDLTPSPPGAAEDWADLLQTDGSTQSVTVTLSAGDYCMFTNDDKGYSMSWPRFIRPTVDQDPGADVTFSLVLRLL